MLSHYLLSAVRNIVKHKLYTFINVFGLAIGLAACLLIILFVRYETGYDSFLSDPERVYRLEATANIPGRAAVEVSRYVGPSKELLPQDYDEVEEVLRMQERQGTIRRGEDTFNESIMNVDANFFRVFDLPFIEGSPETALARTSSIILTRDMAEKYFGEGPYLGQTLTLNDVYERDMVVTGVIENIPNDSHLDLSMMIPIDRKMYEDSASAGSTDLERWNGLVFYVYVKLKEGRSIDNMKATINDWVDRYFPPEISALVNIPGSELFTPRLVPVLDIHMYSPALGDMKPHGSLTTIYSFAGIAFLILLIAAINFMNLATARSTLRSREVAVRKVMGAARKQLFAQFEGESVILAFIALFLGGTFLYGLLPYFNEFTQREISFGLLAEPLMLSATLGLTLLVGLLAGLHPALVLSNIRPARVLMANQSSSPTSTKLRSILVVAQFAISAALIIAAAIIYVQTDFARTVDLGYVKENKMVVRGLRSSQIGDARETFKTRVAALDGVTGVSLASFAPGDFAGSGLSLQVPGFEERLVIFYRSVDWDFFALYDVEPVAGRLFSRDFGGDRIEANPDPESEEAVELNVVINLSAVRRLGFQSAEEAIGKIFYRGQDNQNISTIVGVVPDVHFTSPRQQLEPEIFFYDPEAIGSLNIAYNSEDPEALGEEIDAIFKEMFPTNTFFRQYVADNVEGQFRFEVILGTLLGIFSGLAILVASMGLFGLASFTVARRTKEIGLRKVMGATSGDIVRLLLIQFSIPVLIANVIAWPVGWFAMNEWIQSFVFRIDLGLYFVGITLVAGAVTLLISWATISGHAIRVARSSPILALRYE